MPSIVLRSSRLLSTAQQFYRGEEQGALGGFRVGAWPDNGRAEKGALGIVQHIWKELLSWLLPPEKGPWKLPPLPQGVTPNQAHPLPYVLIAQGRVWGPSAPLDLGCFSAELAAHGDLVQGAVWSRDGSLVSTTCKVSRWAVKLKEVPGGAPEGRCALLRAVVPWSTHPGLRLSGWWYSWSRRAPRMGIPQAFPHVSSPPTF